MIKTVNRWYDVQCDAPDCERLASAEYQHCLGWVSPMQAVKAAVEAGWQRRSGDDFDRSMYCPLHKREDRTFSTYRAECAVCGGTEYIKTTGTIYDAYDDFIRRGWNNQLTVCPDCAKKGQAK